jgi:alkanesulfonate monooxygenase SsuD/methylene tetrahydromethanopterin reductase-like flavin-dependent oxidoreductase (luciferase family)
MNVDFGWEIPTGQRRMPGRPELYVPHLRRILDYLSGHFHSAWLPDHFVYEQTDVPEAMSTLNYLAGLYPALYFGTVVLGQNYRNPALLAKMAATTQWLSGGRLILGLGAGWKQDEYQAYGYEFPPIATRIAQLAEVAQICRAMWHPYQAQVTFHGQYYHIEQAVCNPKPTPPPPLMIGGAGEKRMLRLIAQHADWWNLVGVSAETYARKLEILRQHCAEVGRNPAEIRKTWMGVVSIATTRRQAEAAMANYPIWAEDTPIIGTPAQVISQLHHYTLLGVDCFIIGLADEPGLAGLELFIQEVIPYFR